MPLKIKFRPTEFNHLFILPSQKKRKIFWLFWLLLIAGLCSQTKTLWAQGSQAEKKAAQQDQPLKLKTELMEVRAVVTDKQGKIVKNLNKEDFEITENNKSQAISFFSAENLRDASLSIDRVPTAPIDKNPAPSAKEVSRTVVIFIDTLHLSNTSFLRLKQTLLKFINEQLTDGDLAAVVTTSGNLGVFSQFTRDKEVLRKALDRVSNSADLSNGSLYTPFLAAQVEQNVPFALEAAMNIVRAEEHLPNDPLFLSLVRDRAISKARQILAEATYGRRLTLLTLKAVAERLAAMPGQRLVLALSDGFTMLDNSGTVDSSDLQTAISRAARSGVVIYSYLAKGLSTLSFYDVSNGRMEADGAIAGKLVSFTSAGDRELENGLSQIAKETGGEAFLTTNDLNGALEKTLNNNSFYYALSYYPAGDDKNTFRRVKVRVKNHPDYQVRTQTGYLLGLMHTYLSREVEVLEIRNKISSQAQEELGKAQRDYILREQMKQIQKELGEGDPEQAESLMMRERVEKADLPEDIRKEAERELRRLERLPAAAPDYNVIRTYLEWILELPWNKSTEDTLDLNNARVVLDEDHYDLVDIKDRILEHLAVIKLNPTSKAPILCFVGPPGVGKTSLGQSIARSMGRQFERMSLGGVRDEAELRGHRRTYIGSMPGRIIQALRRAGVNNPVMMLDEVDKLGMDFRGDPASALLEILDPAQNFSFRDHYLDLPFDLSKVFFIATANSLAPIPPALRDRMEIIQLAGYTEEEKLHIAKRYLVPRQIKEAGLTEEQILIKDETIQAVIARYTREAGVRQLERTMGRLARKVALKVAQGKGAAYTIMPDDLEEYLGHERFFQETARESLPPGVATGLAVTEMGGEVLFIEATLLPAARGLTITGQLGEVMQESARAAYSYLWSHAKEIGIKNFDFDKNGIHVHVPAGAIPKDGPSAGVTIVSAFASLLTNRPVRHDTAMTGEITLSGLVFPIGGVKGKVLAARRAGIKRVILPKRNEPDVKDIPEEVLQDLEIIFVETIDELLQNTLTPAPQEQELLMEEATKDVDQLPPVKETGVDGQEAHA